MSAVPPSGRAKRDLSEREFIAAMLRSGWSKVGMFLGYWQHTSGLHVSRWNVDGLSRRRQLAYFRAAARRAEARAKARRS